MSSKKIYVADTHALVWFFMADSRLGSAARDVIRKASKTCRIIVPDSLEMHDALIVATSIFYYATLITKDEVIIKNDCVKTLW